MNVEPIASRRPAVDDTVELRQQCPSWALAVVEAVAGNRGLPRPELVNSILCHWASERVREAKRIEAVLRGNPAPVEAAGEPSV